MAEKTVWKNAGKNKVHNAGTVKPVMWEFWVWLWPDTWQMVGQVWTKWPVPSFEKKAKSHGYNRLVTDRSLIGGYFVNQDGNVMVCVYPGADPKAIYG